jgi:hypothetical protein
VGEATNPGPQHTRDAAPLDAPQHRWVRREVASTCPQCETRLLATGGRVYNVSTDKTVPQGKKILSCNAGSPLCIAIMGATDPKYTCKTCGLEFCHPCTEGLVPDPNPTRAREATASSSASGSNGPAVTNVSPDDSWITARTDVPTNAQPMTVRGVVYDERWELARVQSATRARTDSAHRRQMHNVNTTSDLPGSAPLPFTPHPADLDSTDLLPPNLSTPHPLDSNRPLTTTAAVTHRTLVPAKVRETVGTEWCANCGQAKTSKLGIYRCSACSVCYCTKNLWTAALCRPRVY